MPARTLAVKDEPVTTRTRRREVVEEADEKSVARWKVLLDEEKVGDEEFLGFFLIRAQEPDEDGRVKAVPFVFRDAQRKIHELEDEVEFVEKKYLELHVPKARKLGISTHSLARYGFTRILRRSGYEVILTAHKAQATTVHRSLLRSLCAQVDWRALEELGYEILEDTRLSFAVKHPNGMVSRIDFLTARSDGLGRGGTPNVLISTERPHYPAEAKKQFFSILGSMAKVRGNAWIDESTANGEGDEFHNDCKRARDRKGIGRLFFLAAYEHPLNYLRFDSPAAQLAFVASLGDLAYGEKDEEARVRARVAAFWKKNAGTEEDADQAALEFLHWRRMEIDSGCRGSVEHFHQENPCLTADARISTGRGIVSIAEAVVADVTESGDLVAWKKNEPRPVFRVTTRAGRVLRGTAEHPIATPGGSFIRIDNLIAGHRIALRPPRFAAAKHVEEWSDIPGVRSRLVVNEDWGEFLGYFMGDGSYRNGVTQFALTEEDADVVARVADLSARILGGNPKFRNVSKVKGRRGQTRVTVAKMATKPIFARLGIIKRWRNVGGWKRSVHVPDAIWRSPRRVVARFLSALFECDGSAQANGIAFATRYQDFARDVQLLLLGFGVTSKITRCQGDAGTGGRHSYEWFDMRLSVAASEVFAREIGFIGKRKRARTYERKTTGRTGRPRQPVELVDEVESVVPDGDEITFDIQVEPERVFSANGILTHNCTLDEAFLGSGRPVFDVRILRTWGDAAARLSGTALVGTLRDTETGVSFTPSAGAPFKVYEAPQKGECYVWGMDVASGRRVRSGTGETADWTVVLVANAYTGRTVAKFRDHLTTPDAARTLVRIARWYADQDGEPARGYVELGGGYGDSVVSNVLELEDGAWEHILLTTSTDSKPRIQEGEDVLYGFSASRQGKALLKGTEEEFINLEVGVCKDEEARSPWDLETLEEMKLYAYNEHAGMEASSGHDDCTVSEMLKSRARMKLQVDGLLKTRSAAAPTKRESDAKRALRAMDERLAKESEDEKLKEPGEAWLGI